MPVEINSPHFPRQLPGLDQMEAMLKGKLVVVDGCLRIESFDAQVSYLPIWPNGYGLGLAGNDIKVSDETGETVVARVGEGVSMGGGEIPNLEGFDEFTLGEIPDDCTGPYWLVGAGTHLIPLEPAFFRSEANHLEATVPAGWAAYEGEEYLARPFTGIVAFNSWGEQGFWVRETITPTEGGASYTYSPQSVLAQIPQDGAYIVLVWQSGGPPPEPDSLGPEYEGNDLSGLWQSRDCRQSSGRYIDFYKFERILRLEIYCGPQASNSTADDVNSLLSSWRFDNLQSPILNLQSLPPLTLDSDSETIRKRILYSYQHWQTMWVDAQISDYSSGAVSTQRVQVWLNQPAQARVLTGPVDGAPANLWISDGQMTRTGEDLSGYGLDGSYIAPVIESNVIYPHPMTGILPTPLSSLLFPSGLAQRGGTYRPIAIENIAGRETLVVEWNRPNGPLVDRFWVDSQTGVILRQQNYGKGADGALTSEYLITNIQYDLTFPSETFNRLAPFPPAFSTAPDDITSSIPLPPGTVAYTVQEGDTFAKIANDFGMTLEAFLSLNNLSADESLSVGQVLIVLASGSELDTSMAYGEIYMNLQTAGGNENAGLARFPASCLATGASCPQPLFVPGLPEGFGFPGLNWSPDGNKMVYLASAAEDQVWILDRPTQTWSLLDVPYFSGIAWSPDGKWLAGQPIIHGNEVSNPVLLVASDGSDWVRLMTDVPGYKSPVGWLDNERFLLVNALDNEMSGGNPLVYSELQAYNNQNGEIAVLARHQWDANNYGLGVPILSPDRSQIAYSLNDGNGNQGIVIDLNAGEQSQFPISPGARISGWAPDGHHLVLTAGLGYSCEIHLIPMDGSDDRLLYTSDEGGGCNPVWSPDGEYLLVPALAQNPTIPRLYVINVATAESRLVELPDVGVAFEWPVVSWVP